MAAVHKRASAKRDMVGRAEVKRTPLKVETSQSHRDEENEKGRAPHEETLHGALRGGAPEAARREVAGSRWHYRATPQTARAAAGWLWDDREMKGREPPFWFRQDAAGADRVFVDETLAHPYTESGIGFRSCYLP